ncbi:hypothetical protein BDN72DRAFT_962276 [Pluteus cervinus]|uniref:Uncharacterized protein n=1 Tax=Pluteus cervinus TaxID=181527 RepID=A0ACD3AIP9_9AGAR|nr:hypothetical protein BDN72DRAFT_962276 [Pluteus cervinus]
MSDPIFPREIESVIFTDALVLNDGGESARKLILVAKRVYYWLIPKIMQTIAVRTMAPSRSYPFRLDLNTFREHGTHTKQFFIWLWDGHQLTADEYLAHCPNITDLVLWTTTGFKHSVLDVMSHLPLTHLSINLGYVDETTPALISLFSRVTHLDCLTTLTSETYEAKVKYFTSLTHLAIPVGGGQMKIQTLFEKFLKLRVLVVFGSGKTMGLTGSFDPKQDDPRIVRMTFQPDLEVDEWLLDVEEGRGVWGLADEAVQERKKLKEKLTREME